MPHDAPPAILRACRLILIVVVATLVCGIPYWPVAYREVSLPGNPPTSTFLIGGALAGLLAARLLRPARLAPILAVTGGFVIAVLGRVTVETARDPTSHNLWPFEVVIIGGIGLIAASLGVGIGAIFWRRSAD